MHCELEEYGDFGPMISFPKNLPFLHQRCGGGRSQVAIGFFDFEVSNQILPPSELVLLVLCSNMSLSKFFIYFLPCFRVDIVIPLFFSVWNPPTIIFIFGLPLLIDLRFFFHMYFNLVEVYLVYFLALFPLILPKQGFLSHTNFPKAMVLNNIYVSTGLVPNSGSFECAIELAKLIVMVWGDIFFFP